MYRSFRPTDHLASVVGARRISVDAAECRKRTHATVLPSGKESATIRATPILVQWVEIGSLSDAHDCGRIVIWPFHGAVRPSECAERGGCAVLPNHRDLGLIAGKKRKA